VVLINVFFDSDKGSISALRLKEINVATGGQPADIEVT